MSKRRSEMPRFTIFVSGMIAADPHHGGATWAVLQYLLGFKRLGHDVYFVEPVSDASLRPAGSALAASVNARYFSAVMEDFGLEPRSALVLAGTRQTIGLPYSTVVAAAKRADVLFNVSGMLTDAELFSPIPIRVYLDLDPTFNQLWHAASGIDMRFDGHTHFVTVGQAIGSPDSAVPTCGRRWIGTFQPVVLSHWPRATGPGTALTTVGNWRGYGSIEHDRVLYGQKAHAWRPLIGLPTMSSERFSMALRIHPDETADLEALARNGWHVVDPDVVARDPQLYRAFIQGSKAELGIAKSGYVASRCGWFSDRSACYLASGRPVIAQETGFSAFLPTGEGLFGFETSADVLAGIETINADYPRHAGAARELAEAFLIRTGCCQDSWTGSGRCGSS